MSHLLIGQFKSRDHDLLPNITDFVGSRSEEKAELATNRRKSRFHSYWSFPCLHVKLHQRKRTCRKTRNPSIFVATAKNTLQSQHFIDTEGVTTIPRRKRGDLLRTLARRRTRLELRTRPSTFNFKTMGSLTMTFWNQAYMNIKVTALTK